MRSEGSFVLYIVVFAILVYNGFNLLKNKKSFKDIKMKGLVPILSKVAILIICFNMFLQLFGYSLRTVGITDYEYKNRNIYWKFVLMWLDNDFSIQFISPGTKFNDRELNYIVRLEKVEYTLIIILSFLSIYILILLISANWVIYLFIEIQTRYRHFIMPGLFILSGFSLYRISRFVKQKILSYAIHSFNA